MVIRIYWASVCGNRKIDGNQTRLRNIIESLNIESTWVDIAQDPLLRQKMREESGKPKALPPQIFNEDRYLGEVEDMDFHIEQGTVKNFFGLVGQDAVDGNAKINGEIANEAIVQPIKSSEPCSAAPFIENKNVENSKKSVLAAVNNFESSSKKTEINKPKKISITLVPVCDKPIDEERRRKILGISTTNNGEVVSNA